MNHRTTASEIMTSTIHSVRPSDPLRKVVGLLCKNRISGVPVVDGKGRLVGLISERDVLEAMYPDRPELRQRRAGTPGAAGERDIASIASSEIMVGEVITAAPDTDILRLASLMAVNKIRRIPIVEEGCLVGIVSQGDVYRAIFERGGGE
jgi:CBS domain-containing protein